MGAVHRQLPLALPVECYPPMKSKAAVQARILFTFSRRPCGLVAALSGYEHGGARAVSLIQRLDTGDRGHHLPQKEGVKTLVQNSSKVNLL